METRSEQIVEAAQRVLAAVLALEAAREARDRLIVEAIDFDGMTHAHAAHLAGLSNSGVRRLLCRDWYGDEPEN